MHTGRSRLLALLCLLSLAALAGCVERKLLIRSKPSGAPAWVDEEPYGSTPTTVEFQHYGGRRIRVGPVRNKQGKMVNREAEKLVRLEAPWYETFPLGFVSEVVWPFTITDRRVVELTLEPRKEGSGDYGEEAAKKVLEKARDFREKALSPGAGAR